MIFQPLLGNLVSYRPLTLAPLHASLRLVLLAALYKPFFQHGGFKSASSSGLRLIVLLLSKSVSKKKHLEAVILLLRVSNQQANVSIPRPLVVVAALLMIIN